MRKLASCLLRLVALAALPLAALPLAAHAGEAAAAQATAEEQKPVDWESWHAGNSVSDLASLQRGARNFMNYCNGCHAIKYMRYQRMADDLKIPAAALAKELVAPGSHPLDYITTSMPPADAVNWFGKVPPDLSLITRSKGTDYVYRLFKTFYADPTSATGTNNLAYPGAGDAGSAVGSLRSQRSRVQSGQGWHQDLRPLRAAGRRQLDGAAIRPVCPRHGRLSRLRGASRYRSTGFSSASGWYSSWSCSPG